MHFPDTYKITSTRQPCIVIVYTLKIEAGHNYNSINNSSNMFKRHRDYDLVN